MPIQTQEVVRLVRARHPRAATREILRAFEVARVAHEGQVRKSGEAYIDHPVSVAYILADLGMDVTSIVAALLHDAVEDTDLELEDIGSAFGQEVAAIIDGLTKIKRIGYRSREQE
ncbi:MAG: HD domain-containing protein, partial [Actinomycetota bacterium]